MKISGKVISYLENAGNYFMLIIKMSLIHIPNQSRPFLGRKNEIVRSVCFYRSPYHCAFCILQYTKWREFNRTR